MHLDSSGIHNQSQTCSSHLCFFCWRDEKEKGGQQSKLRYLLIVIFQHPQQIALWRLQSLLSTEVCYKPIKSRKEQVFLLVSTKHPTFLCTHHRAKKKKNSMAKHRPRWGGGWGETDQKKNKSAQIPQGSIARQSAKKDPTRLIRAKPQQLQKSDERKNFIASIW